MSTGAENIFKRICVKIPHDNSLFFGVHEDNPTSWRPFMHLHVEGQCIDFVCNVTFESEHMATRFAELVGRILCETKKTEIDLKGHENAKH